MDVQESPVERLAKSAPGAEIWWDSSPLVYESWAKKMLREAMPERRSQLREQLRRMYDPWDPTQTIFRGVTTNPPLSLAAINDNPDYWSKWIDSYARENPGKSVDEVFWALYKEIVCRGAELFRPVYEASGRRFGHISGQVDPRGAFDADMMLRQALELSALAPNVMIKVPGTAEGVKVIKELTSRGIATNLTLGFVVSQFVTVAEAVLEGLHEARAKKVDLSGWKSVVTDMSTRWEEAGEFRSQAAMAGFDLTVEIRRWASIAIFKQAYRLFRARAYPSKMLLCSVRMGPMEGGVQRVWHLEHTAGADAVYTLPPAFLTPFINEATHIDFKPRIWEDIPGDVMARLCQMPYFIQGFEEGLKPEEFNTLEPLQNTYREFSGAMEKILAFVRSRISA